MRRVWIGAVGLWLAVAASAGAAPPPQPVAPSPPASFVVVPPPPPADAAPPPPPPHEPLTLPADDPTQHVYLYADAEYLLWWVRKSPLPVPLLTGDRTNGANPATSGGLADPNTIVLFGNSGGDYNTLSGGRLRAGWLLGGDCSVEAAGFRFGQAGFHFDAASDSSGSPVLFRPIINASPLAGPAAAGGGANAGETVSAPRVFAGSFDASGSLTLWGAEVNGVWNIRHSHGLTIDFLAGFRHLNLQEDLLLRDSTTSLGGTLFFLGQSLVGPGNVESTFDRFNTHNEFFGGQVGARVEARHGCFSLSAVAKVAVGGNAELVTIDGGTTAVTAAGAAASARGGVLATPSILGHFSRSELAFVPELNVNVGYDVTGWLRVFAGYNLLYYSSVVRPGDQVNLFLNDTQNPGAADFTGTLTGVRQPRVTFRESDFWAHGLNVGLELRY
jgi:hypothetical protein